MNLPGSYEAFLKTFAPEAFALLVMRPVRRRRARAALVTVLSVAVVALCGWALAASALTSHHVSVARGHHHRHASHAVIHRDPDHDVGLAEVV